MEPSAPISARVAPYSNRCESVAMVLAHCNREMTIPAIFPTVNLPWASRAFTVLHLDTERGWRGGERQALWLAQELARAGMRCLVAARSGEPLLQRAAIAGLETVACNPLFEGDPVTALRLR